jgi:ribosomal protein S18 acetylase RimI-like enzyme
MSERVLCRWATRWDREALIAHLGELMHFHGEEPDLDTLRQSLEYALKYPERVRFAVAQRGDKVVGCMSLHDCYSTWRAMPFGQIQDVFIVEEERGSGMAQELFEFTVAEAMRRHYCRIDLEVLESNSRARAFYEKMGMKWGECLTYSMRLGGTANSLLPPSEGGGNG